MNADIDISLIHFSFHDILPSAVFISFLSSLFAFFHISFFT